MPRYDQHCLSCAWDAEIVARPGDHPPCPQCGGKTERIWRKSAAVIGDEIDYVDHNLGRNPIRIRSRAERRRLMKERGLVESVRHVDHPESPRLNHTTNWALGYDAYTANNVRELLERAFRQRGGDEDDTRPVARISEHRTLDSDEAERLIEVTRS